MPRSFPVLAAASLLVAGCVGEQPAADPVPPAARRGELLSLACQACHALTPDTRVEIGPSLYGVFGRPAASLPDFEYSQALREAQFVWTAERLDAWLQAPTDYLPGTTMVFAGYADAGDRRALIAWLQSATAAAQP